MSCIFPGCGKPTWNGEKNEYCSRVHAYIGNQMPCIFPGCLKPKLKPGDYCSEEHKQLGDKMGMVAGKPYRTNVLGYVAVPSHEVDGILGTGVPGDGIPGTGFVCSTTKGKRRPSLGQLTCHTARINVPFHIDRLEAVKTAHKYHPDIDYTILEILKEANDKEKIPDVNIHFNKGGDGYIIPQDPETQVLDKKFLSQGTLLVRNLKDYLDTPCPCCQQKIPEDLDKERGHVGRAKFVGNAFMVSPCMNEKCKTDQHERQERLRTQPKMKLYHACAREIANEIYKCGGKLIRGSCGAGGGGIYFAHTPRETEWKAEDKFHKSFLRDAADKGLGEYVVLECEVAMGNPCKGGREYLSMDFATAFHERGGPYDSVILDRGETGFPVPAAPVKGTRIEDLKHGERSHPGYEFIVYSWDQVKILGEVPRDPVPRKGAA